MAALPSLITVEQYLSTPELFERHEYVDGVVVAKPMGTWKHGALQVWVGALLLRYFPHLRIATELHTRLRETEWRLPDIAVQSKNVATEEKYGLQPLLLAIEILSPEDRLGAAFAKCERYHAGEFLSAGFSILKGNGLGATIAATNRRNCSIRSQPGTHH